MQVNKLETSKKLKMIEMQGEMLKKSKKNYEITDREISAMSPDTRYIKVNIVNHLIVDLILVSQF